MVKFSTLYSFSMKNCMSCTKGNCTYRKVCLDLLQVLQLKSTNLQWLGSLVKAHASPRSHSAATSTLPPRYWSTTPGQPTTPAKQPHGGRLERERVWLGLKHTHHSGDRVEHESRTARHNIACTDNCVLMVCRTSLCLLTPLVNQTLPVSTLFPLCPCVPTSLSYPSTSQSWAVM